MPHSFPIKSNNFDLLRFTFALIVCVVHTHSLSNLADLNWASRLLSSSIAVKSFFIVSGFLIFMSFERSSSLKNYIEKRIRRIYPAYFFVVVFFGFSLYFSSNENSFYHYFSKGWFKYMLANLSFLNFIQPNLPGVFEGNKLQAVNGALWTLKIEVMFYICVPFLVMLFRRTPKSVTLFLGYSLSITYAYIMNKLAVGFNDPIFTELSRQLPGQLCYFLSGAALFYFYDFFKRHFYIILIPAILFFSFESTAFHFVFEPIALAVVIISLATTLHLGDFGKYGDFSYGIYIFHFPIIQLFLNLNLLTNNGYIFLTAILMTTISASILSWHLIEKRFLSKKYNFTTK